MVDEKNPSNGGLFHTDDLVQSEKNVVYRMSQNPARRRHPEFWQKDNDRGQVQKNQTKEDLESSLNGPHRQIYQATSVNITRPNDVNGEDREVRDETKISSDP